VWCWGALFGLLSPHLILKFGSSRLDFLQSLLQVGHFLLDLGKLRQVLAVWFCSSVMTP